MDISSVNSDLIRGNVTTIILGSLWSQDRYGYDILKEIETRSEGQYKLKQPTLYNQLKRLEKQGLISSYDGDPDDTGGGRRRYYSLTAEGRNFLVKERTEYEYSRTILDKLVSDRAFDFDADAAPFNTDDLRPYIKKDGEKSRVVYKEKEVEKVVYVEKKIYFDAEGNEVDEETARASAARAALSDEELAELDAKKEREIEELNAAHRTEIERIQAENRMRYEKLSYEMTDALNKSEADRAEAVARIEAERQEAVRRLEKMLDNANLVVADKIGEIEARHREEIDRLVAERTAEIERTETALKEEAEQLAEEKQAEIEELRRSRETELEEMEARHREEMYRLAAEREEELKRLAEEKQAEIDEIRRSRETEIEEIEARHREEIERINAESSALSEEIEARRAAFEAEREEELKRLEEEREETEKKFEEERRKFEEEKREEDEKREEYARIDAARREELERIEKEREKAEKRLEEERAKFREEIRAEEERREAEERTEMERKAEEERMAREREEALMSQATMSLSDIFRELDARSEYTAPSANDEKLVVEDAEWVVPASSEPSADAQSPTEEKREPVVVTVKAYDDEEEEEEKNSAPATSSEDEEYEDDLPFSLDDLYDDEEKEEDAAKENEKPDFDDAHSEKLREIAEELAYVRKKIDALDAEAATAPYAADLLRRAEIDSEKVYESKSEISEKSERVDAGYVTPDNLGERRQPETTLRDLFRRLDERAAEIDSKKQAEPVAEEPAEEPVYEAEATPAPERGEFAMSSVRASRTEPFAYERGDVNYKEFFATVAAESSPEQETEKAPQEPAVSHSDTDLKTRLYTEGFKLRPYDRGSTAEYYTFNFVRSNRLLRDCWLIVLAVFLVEVAAMWASTATMISYVYYLPIIAGGTILMLIPSFMYLSNPSKRRRADFNVKLSFINRFMIMIELAVILVLVAFFGVGVSVQDTTLILMTMVLPIILLTNLPLSSIVYYLLYRTRKYHTA